MEQQGDMRRIVANYFLYQGRKKVYETFIKESQLKQSSHYKDERISNLLYERDMIRKSILNKEIEKVLIEINKISPYWLENNKSIFFNLRKLEIIDKNENNKLSWIRKYIGNFVDENLHYIDNLEDLMMDYLYNNDNENDKLNQGYMKQLAWNINIGIIESNGLTILPVLSNIIYIQNYLLSLTKERKLTG
eukprot:GHVP01054310.1.p1 GENE.GHVP01054310.1~~GHVP01054310.1.p1  ORF type:complete len:191 (+),score=40.37 GHVP01054310.1:14-586(+)